MTLLDPRLCPSPGYFELSPMPSKATRLVSTKLGPSQAGAPVAELCWVVKSRLSLAANSLYLRPVGADQLRNYTNQREYGTGPYYR